MNKFVSLKTNWQCLLHFHLHQFKYFLTQKPSWMPYTCLFFSSSLISSCLVVFPFFLKTLLLFINTLVTLNNTPFQFPVLMYIIDLLHLWWKVSHMNTCILRLKFRLKSQDRIRIYWTKMQDCIPQKNDSNSNYTHRLDYFWKNHLVLSSITKSLYRYYLNTYLNRQNDPLSTSL